MGFVDDDLRWEADGTPIDIGLTRFGEGPHLLLLPALSSISTRMEMRPLQEQLGTTFSTIAIDWPGFGTLPRPKIKWRPHHYSAFLRFVLEEIVQPFGTIAAGHAASYVLAQAADDPASTGRLCLLSPTWRGPLPMMTGRRMALFRGLVKAIDLPLAGSALYRLNVNGPVIGMMARGHVYGTVVHCAARADSPADCTRYSRPASGGRDKLCGGDHDRRPALEQPVSRRWIYRLHPRPHRERVRAGAEDSRGLDRH